MVAKSQGTIKQHELQQLYFKERAERNSLKYQQGDLLDTVNKNNMDSNQNTVTDNSEGRQR